MIYKNLGHSNIKVSTICLGTMTWGEQNTENEAFQQMDMAFDYGVNFFDTADVYGDGRSEKFVGNFINSISERIYVVTKAGRRINPHVANGYYDKDLMESFVDRSLSNLNIETI